MVPPNWDSWGKIRVLGGTFEAELVSQGWAEDNDERFGTEPITLEKIEENRHSAGEEGEESTDAPGPLQMESAIARYEDWCQDPDSSGLALVESVMNNGNEVTVQSEDTQTFLENQQGILEAFKSKVRPEKITPTEIAHLSGIVREREAVSEHIGPVQFNVGGIHVDADDMLQRIKVCTLSPFWRLKAAF